jgi:hypothetical protein
LGEEKVEEEDRNEERENKGNNDPKGSTHDLHIYITAAKTDGNMLNTRHGCLQTNFIY